MRRKEKIMNDMQVSEALLKAILELIGKVKDLDELRDLINSLPEGTVYSLNLEVVELGQET